MRWMWRLSLLPGSAAARWEIYRLHARLLERELTGIITLKSGGNEPAPPGQRPFSFMQYMANPLVRSGSLAK